MDLSRDLVNGLAMAKIAVVGAGISGLACARHLVAAGHGVRVIEKSRSFGGRCASRLWEGAVIDSGVQYFRMRDRVFEQAMQELCGEDLQALATPVRDATGAEISGSDPKWYHRAGNNRIGRAMAAGLDVQRETPVSEIRSVSDGVSVDGERYDAVVSGAPWPQTVAMLGDPGAGESEDRVYERCLTAAFAYHGDPTGFSAETYAVLAGGSGGLAWSACENHKLGRVPQEVTVIILQAGPDFSLEHYESAPDVWTGEVRAELEQRWQLKSSDYRGVFAHRWKFSRRVADVGGINLPKHVHLCGDSLTESKLEAVWLDGVRAADEVLQSL